MTPCIRLLCTFLQETIYYDVFDPSMRQNFHVILYVLTRHRNFSLQVPVKMVLFQPRGSGHRQDDAMPNFFPNFKSSKLGLSNEVSFFSVFIWRSGQISSKIFLKTPSNCFIILPFLIFVTIAAWRKHVLTSVFVLHELHPVSIMSTCHVKS